MSTLHMKSPAVKMHGSNAESDYLPRVADFFNSKSIFLTGASGFVGSVLMETLLRVFPGIKSIYILLRKQKNVSQDIRKEQIFNKKIFIELKKESPELLKKVRVISGDISLPNLGMSQDDTLVLLEEVSIVFHCAAMLNFQKPLELLLKNNVLSLDTVIQLCRKMRKFEVLVYTSTAYSNSNYRNTSLKEEVYRLPSHAGLFLDAIKNKDLKKLEELVSLCKPDWPNNYCFSKCVAENVVADTASDLAIAIVRPSIIVGTMNLPVPGYLEEGSGYSVIFLGVGKGFIQVVNADPECLINFVPADIVAKTHVLAAWSLGTKKCMSPLIVNCTAAEHFQMKVNDHYENLFKLVDKFPMPQSFAQFTYVNIVSNKFVYCLLAALCHYIPAIFFDGISKIWGKKTKMYSQYRSVEKVMSSLYFFTYHSFQFDRSNFKYLDKLIGPEDKKALTINFEDATMREAMFLLPKGSSFYDWKLDKKSQSERQKIKEKQYFHIRFIQCIFLIVCCLLIYWAFSSVF